MTNHTNQARERVAAVARGGTINETYKKFPIEALAAFRADLLILIEATRLAVGDEPDASLRERNRLMGDVIDFACGHIDNASDAMDFLDAYRMDRHNDNPAFVRFQQVQRDGADAMRKAETKGKG